MTALGRACCTWYTTQICIPDQLVTLLNKMMDWRAAEEQASPPRLTTQPQGHCSCPVASQSLLATCRLPLPKWGWNQLLDQSKLMVCPLTNPTFIVWFFKFLCSQPITKHKIIHYAFMFGLFNSLTDLMYVAMKGQLHIDLKGFVA